MNAGTYVQRIAANYAQSMAPFPEPLDIADEHLADCAPERLCLGLAGLHEWMAGMYRGAADSPGDYGLPGHPDVLPRSGSRYTASVHAFEAIPMLIYGLGLSGTPQKRDDQTRLQVDEERLAVYCREAGLKKAPLLLDALGKHGLEVAPDAGTNGVLALSFREPPEIALALPAFVRACCALAKKTGRPPLEFCRADMRVMQPVRGRRRPPPVTVADALRSLDDERATVLAELDRLVESLGFRATFRCSSLNRGEWRGSYVSSKLGRTLFSCVVEEGQLGARIMIGETGQILPALAQCPPALGDAFCAAHTCQKCGKCKVGPVRFSLDGVSRRLCNYALFELPDVRREQVAGIEALLEAQASVLKAGPAG